MTERQVTYLFIDGAYLRQAHDEAMHSVFGVPGDLAIERVHDHAQAFRTYYYDCEEVLKPGESEADFSARTKPQAEFFSRVQSLKAVHLQLGSLKGRRRRQKEVDILLAVDMLTHGFNRNMSRAVLVAGDLDFRPVVEALVRGGVFVEVWYDKNSRAAELPLAADFGAEISWHTLYKYNTEAFCESHKPPRHLQGGAEELPILNVLARGSFEGGPAKIVDYPSRYSKILSVELTSGVLWFEHSDEKVLKGYFARLYGPVEWT